MFDVASLSDTELIARLTSGERLIAATQAQQIALTAELHRRAPEWITRADPSFPGMDPAEVTAAEIGPALRISRRAASDRVHFALTVLSRLPASVAALAAGALTLTRLRMIAEHTAVLDDLACVAVEAQVLVRAGQQTPGGLGVSLARAVMAADPAAAERRHDTAVAERRVDLYPAEDGMSILRALLPAPDALRAYRALTDAAKASGAKHAGHAADTACAADPIGAARAAEPTDNIHAPHARDPGGNVRVDAEVDIEDAAEGSPGAAGAGRCPETLDSRRADLFLNALLNLDPPCEAIASNDHRSEGHASEDGAAESHANNDHACEVGHSEGGHGGGGATNEPGDHRRVPDTATKPASRRSAHAPAAIRVTVPWTTLAGLDDQPGQLHGYGAITADTVRRLAADASWIRLLTDPATGAVLDVGTTTYSPPAALDRHVRSRDVTCRFPGCRQPADRADLDHTRPHPAGPTSAANLAALCRPDHRLKTLTRWRVEQHPDGTLHWTSPTGQGYDTHPPPVHPLPRPLSRSLPPRPPPLRPGIPWWKPPRGGASCHLRRRTAGTRRTGMSIPMRPDSPPQGAAPSGMLPLGDAAPRGRCPPRGAAPSETLPPRGRCSREAAATQPVKNVKPYLSANPAIVKSAGSRGGGMASRRPGLPISANSPSIPAGEYMNRGVHEQHPGRAGPDIAVAVRHSAGDVEHGSGSGVVRLVGDVEGHLARQQHERLLPP